MPIANPVSPKLAAAFVSDAESSAIMLEELLPKLNSGNFSDADIELYITTVHGMKSSFVNVGETELSAFARKLEIAGTGGEFDAVAAETPIFIQELKACAEKLKAPDSGVEASADDEVFLREKLAKIKTACNNFDLLSANAALDALKTKSWSPAVSGLLDEIAVALLRGELKKIARIAEPPVRI